MTYLHKHRTTGGYHFRRGVPAELRPFLQNKTDWRESLRTKDVAVAKVRVAEVAIRVESMFERRAAAPLTRR